MLPRCNFWHHAATHYAEWFSVTVEIHFGLNLNEERQLFDLLGEDPEVDADGEGDKAEEDPLTEAFAALLTRFGSVLEDKVSEVRLSKRLTESPACLVVPDGGMHAHVERMLRASDPSLQIPVAKRILELNADHPVMTHEHGQRQALLSPGHLESMPRRARQLVQRYLDADVEDPKSLQES